MTSFQRSVSAAAIPLSIFWKRRASKPPLIRRSVAFDFLPQYPTWFCNEGHTSAKIRFLQKLRNSYSVEALSGCPNCDSNHSLNLATQERSGLPTSVALCLDCALVFTNPRLDEQSLL